MFTLARSLPRRETHSTHSRHTRPHGWRPNDQHAPAFCSPSCEPTAMRLCESRAAAASRPPGPRLARAKAPARLSTATWRDSTSRVQIASLWPLPPRSPPLQRPRRRERRAPSQRSGTRCPAPRKSCRRQVQRRELQAPGPSQLSSRSTSICDCTSAPAATCKRRPRAERGPTSPRRSPPERPHARSSPPKSPWGSVTLVPCAEQRPAASRATSGAPMLVPRAEPAASGRPWRTLARAVH
jgi:hypothetical protein